jgi:hypothetical protein
LFAATRNRNYDAFIVRVGRVVAIRACHDRHMALAIANVE